MLAAPHPQGRPNLMALRRRFASVGTSGPVVSALTWRAASPNGRLRPHASQRCGHRASPMADGRCCRQR
eukprot:7075082-Prymnesium_polylepis.1